MKKYKQEIIGWIIVLILVSPLARLFLENTTFIPTSNIDILAVTLCLSIGIIWIYHRRQSRSAAKKIKHEFTARKRRIKPTPPLLEKFLPTLLIFVVAAFLYAGTFLYLGQYYTEYTGTPFKDFILIPQKDDLRDKGCAYQYRVSSPQFTGMLGLRFLCIDEETQNKLPDRMGALLITGKISNWGRNIENYTAPAPTDDINALYNKREKLIDSWKVIPTTE